jgi:hypothetical protein
MRPSLYAEKPAVGLLKGFSPVTHSEHGLPGFGEFLLVEVNETTALVGRVSRYQAAGQRVSCRPSPPPPSPRPPTGGGIRPRTRLS